MSIFFEIHSGLPREAPGSLACTERAFRMVPELPGDPRILDIGCGPGTPTIQLAKLRRAGFRFDRMAKGCHEIWMHTETRARVTVPNHPGEMGRNGSRNRACGRPKN